MTMKNAFRLLALVLALCLAFSLVACDLFKGKDDPKNDNENENNNPSLTVADIAGTYELDAEPWGMNMKWYITINADATFAIVTDRGVDKGHGTVASSDNTFMFLYSDSTPEAMKSATFTYADNKITFSTSIPIGTSNVSTSDEHPDPVYATKTTFTPNAGISYENGNYVATATDGTVYYLTVTAEKTFSIVSSKGFTKSGNFETTETKIISDDTDFVATVGAKILTAELTVDTVKTPLVFYHVTIQGDFKAEEAEGETPYAATLKLDGGNFTLKTGTPAALDYLEENGTFTTKDNYIYLAFSDGETTLVGVVSANGIAVQKVPVDEDVTTSMMFETYTPAAAVDAAYAGTYKGSLDKPGMGGSVHYEFTFELKEEGAYAYVSSFEMGGDTYYYKEEGTASVSGSVLTIKAQKNVTAANMETGTLTDIAAENQTEVTGAIANGVITVSMKPSPMSSTPVEITLTYAPAYVGVYAGELDKPGMGGNVHYDFTFELKDDGTYAYVSAFVMGGDTYYYKEEGTASVKDAVLTIKAQKNVTAANMETGTLTDIAAENQVEVTGALADGVITVSMKPSPMSSTPVEVTFTYVPAYAGVYAGELDKTGMGGNVHYDFTFEIKYNGTYSYTSTFEMGGDTYVYAEEGTASVDGSVLTIKALKNVTAANMETGTLTDIAEENQTEVTGALVDGVITVSIKPSPMSSTPVEVTFNYVPAYAGVYEGELDKPGMGGSVHYDFAFEIKYNGTYSYTSTFEMGGETYVYAEEGTASVDRSVVTVKALKKVTAANMETGELTDIAEENQVEVVGALVDGVITINMYPSPMSSATVEVTLSK